MKTNFIDEPIISIYIGSNQDRMNESWDYREHYLETFISCEINYKNLSTYFIEDDYMSIPTKELSNIDSIVKDKYYLLRKSIEPKIKKWLEEQGWDNSLIYFNVSVYYLD